MSACGVATRCLLDSDGKITVSSLANPEVNADGSVDVYFGPEARKGREKNSVITKPKGCDRAIPDCLERLREPESP